MEESTPKTWLPEGPGNLKAFLEHFGLATRRALLLDYDGTLAPFVADRRLARPYPGVLEVLARIEAGGQTRLAIVSGRAIRDLQNLVTLPLELWGSHGLEHRTPDGRYSAATLEPAAAELLADLRSWIVSRGCLDSLEVKPFGLALHRRPDPAAFAKIAAPLLETWTGPARSSGLALLEFDGGIEFRPGGHHKGEVVNAVLAEMGGAPTAYLGDDETDEDAFRALTGRGLSVLVRPEERPTRAEVWIRPPDELLAFLEAWAPDPTPRPAA